MLDKPPLMDDETRPQHSRKNTKRWCKGKEGVEHLPTVELDKNYGFLDRMGKPRCGTDADILWMNCTHHVVCEKCGKIMASRPEVCPTTGLNLTTGETTR